MTEPIDEIMQFFVRDPAQPVLSGMFADMAGEIVRLAPRSAERTAALRKLLECKDAVERALVVKPVPWRDRASGPVELKLEGGSFSEIQRDWKVPDGS